MRVNVCVCKVWLRGLKMIELNIGLFIKKNLDFLFIKKNSTEYLLVVFLS